MTPSAARLPAPEPGFVAWYRAMGLPEKVARRFWKALTRCDDGRATTFVFGLHHCLSAATDAEMEQRCRGFSDGAGRPALVVALVEVLVGRGILSRSAGTLVQECVFRNLDAFGRWKW
jgi:hypothetical protein